LVARTLALLARCKELRFCLGLAENCSLGRKNAPRRNALIFPSSSAIRPRRTSPL
jgi:hypothetical protein